MVRWLDASDPHHHPMTSVVVYPADLGRCGHRLIWPAQALIDQGADVRLVAPDAESDAQLRASFRRYDDGHRELEDVDDPEADIVVFQRPLQRTLADAIPILQAKGIRVVVEIDDDFTTISSRNVSWADCHPRNHPDRNWDHLARACRTADLVTVTTPALARRYGGHGRVAIIPNHVPASYLAIEPEPHDGVIVGWAGSINTHPNDLQVTRGGVARAIEATGASFAVIGVGTGVQRALSLREPPAASGWLPLERYPEAVAQLDVGIVPLEPTAFNEAKSSLKMTEYSALGVACVASPTGPNVEMARRLGVPIATRGREWEREVRRLVSEPDYRETAKCRAREVMRGWTVEANCEQWWEAWRSARSVTAVGQRAAVR